MMLQLLWGMGPKGARKAQQQVVDVEARGLQHPKRSQQDGLGALGPNVVLDVLSLLTCTFAW